jgi:hypothetical protein
MRWNKAVSTQRATTTLNLLRTSKEKGPSTRPCIGNFRKFILAGVAMFLMCCQGGEVDQTLSLNLLQLRAAPSHTFAV